MQLPLRVQCKTIKGKFYLTTPWFGNCSSWLIDRKHADLTIKMQMRSINNIDFLLKKNDDNYGLLHDKDFYEILKRMTALNFQHQRPNIREIINCRFIQRYVQTEEKKLDKILKSKQQ